MTRVETNTDIFDIADVDANAGFEAGAEASAEGSAIIGQKNELKGEATAGYYQSFKADGKINTDLGSVGGGATVVAPGSVGGAVDYKAGFSDGTLSLGLSLELDVLIAGVGLDMNLDINLLGSSHTRGSQQEIAESLDALVEHLQTFDSQMTEAKLEDAKEDAEAAVAELEEIQSDMRQRAVAIANFIKNEDELRPVYEQKAATAQTEIAGLESVADNLRPCSPPSRKSWMRRAMHPAATATTLSMPLKPT